MRILTFTKRYDYEPKIGLLFRDKYVIDLSLLLIDALVNDYGMEYTTAITYAKTVIPYDTRKFIELFPINSKILDEIMKKLEGLDMSYLLDREIAIDLNNIRFLPVVLYPKKVIGIGLNYEEYRIMLRYQKPEVPLFFFKPSNTLIGHEDYIVIPRGGKWPGTESKCVFHEYEMAIVIGRKARYISRDEAFKYIYGVTIFNDITAHDIEMQQPGHVLYQQRSKAFDTFSPVGPWIVTMDEIIVNNIDLHNLRIARKRNGIVEGESNTKNMIYKVGEIVEFLSEIMTLEPGDIISLGSPPAGPPEGLRPGDVIETELEFIGTLRNYVK